MTSARFWVVLLSLVHVSCNRLPLFGIKKKNKGDKIPVKALCVNLSLEEILPTIDDGIILSNRTNEIRYGCIIFNWSFRLVP
jgi:hypothetical protein